METIDKIAGGDSPSVYDSSKTCQGHFQRSCLACGTAFIEKAKSESQYELCTECFEMVQPIAVLYRNLV